MQLVWISPHRKRSFNNWLHEPCSAFKPIVSLTWIRRPWSMTLLKNWSDQRQSQQLQMSNHKLSIQVHRHNVRKTRVLTEKSVWARRSGWFSNRPPSCKLKCSENRRLNPELISIDRKSFIMIFRKRNEVWFWSIIFICCSLWHHTMNIIRRQCQTAMFFTIRYFESRFKMEILIPILKIFYFQFNRLNENQMHTAKIIGINESTASKLMTGQSLKVFIMWMLIGFE